MRRYLLSFAAFVVCAGSQLRADDPLAQTWPYSLYLAPDGGTEKGYYPMGFIHGDVGITLPMGFNLREDTSCFAGLALSEPFPEFRAAYTAHWNLRYFSLAWPMNAIREATGWNLKKLPIKSPYGDLTAAMDREGNYVAGGDEFNPAVRRYLLDYVQQHVKSRLTDPEFAKRIVFWGLDNEAEGHPNYSPFARAAFAAWLEQQYAGDLARLNANWRTQHATFAAAANGPLPGPADYKTSPALFLDFTTFQSEHFVRLLAEMAARMHETDPLHRGVVHKSTQQTIEMSGANRTRTFDQALFADLIRPYSGGLYGVDMYGAGDREAYEANYIFNCIRSPELKPGYGIMLCEANNHGGPDHQFAATMWRLLGNGVKAMDYFSTGWAGASKDWDLFGFLDPATGKPKAKLFYAARWAQMVHRTEAFWRESDPAHGVPRVAMLMPRRDVLLSDSSDRNKAVSIWSYPENHRWMVFRWLREQGYWVDIIPYTKLSKDFLKQYQGLFLVGAEHLTTEEIKTIGGYVKSGGVLVADARAGLYDEHHGLRNGIDSLLGIEIARPSGAIRGPQKIDESLRLIAKKVSATATDSKPIATDPEGNGVAFLRSVGKGRVLYLPFLLGTLTVVGENWDVASGVGAFLANGPTADGEDYLPYAQEYNPGKWLQARLAQAGLRPSYQAATSGGALRLEQPYMDRRGNLAFAVATRGMSSPEPLASMPVRVALPKGSWSSALWSPSEDGSLRPLEVKSLDDGMYELILPATRSAGIVYFLKDHPPVISLARIDSGDVAVDSQTARVRPGQTFVVHATVINPGPSAFPGGVINCLVPAGWSVASGQVAIGEIAPGASVDASFQVTVAADGTQLPPDRFFPIVLRLNDGKTDVSVMSATVEGNPSAGEVSRLLTDNVGYPETFPHRIATGATYSYVSPGGETGRALTNGYGENSFRASPAWAKDRYATYDSTAVGVVFDLKSAHKIDSAQVVLGPGRVLPTGCKVSVSDDGQTFTEIGSSTLGKDEHELHVPAAGREARYVKLELEWPAPGGTVSEVEIWGR